MPGLWTSTQRAKDAALNLSGRPECDRQQQPIIRFHLAFSHPILMSYSSLDLESEASGPLVGPYQRVTGAVCRPSYKERGVAGVSVQTHSLWGKILRTHPHKELLGFCELHQGKEVRGGAFLLLVRSLSRPLRREQVEFFLERGAGRTALLRVDGVEGDAQAVVSRRAARDEFVKGGRVQTDDAGLGRLAEFGQLLGFR